tara:strand:+ start:3693 stop:4040 length:348 start_codon:yes stop_codon:yes gene_type:complete
MNIKYWGLVVCLIILFIIGLKNSFLKKRIAHLLAKEEKEETRKKKEVLTVALSPIKEEIKKSKQEKHITKKEYRLLQLQEEEIKERLKEANELYAESVKEETKLAGAIAYAKSRK